MRLLPFEQLIIKTSLSASEVIQRIDGVIEHRSALQHRLAGLKHQLYRGRIKGNCFLLQPILQYQNTFLPQINGVIEPEVEGCIIVLTVKLHIFTIIALVFLLSFIGVMILFAVAPILQVADFSTLPGIIVLIGMFILGYVLPLRRFEAEVLKSKLFLQDLLQVGSIENYQNGPTPRKP